jgi:hypothetical protein
MDYGKIYRDFIDDRKAKPRSTGYTETHHILPRSLGGTDHPSNLIRLSAADHYFAHCCLAKMHGGKMWSALFAVAAMAKTSNAAEYFGRRRMVAAARVRAAAVRSEDMKRRWADGSFTRSRVYKPWTEEQRARHSLSSKGRISSPESVQKARDTKSMQAEKFNFVGPDGQQFTGSAVQFRTFSGMSQSLASYLTRGKIKSAKGWRLESTPPNSIRGRDCREWLFERLDGTSFVGTGWDLRTQFNIDCGSTSKLLSGKLKMVGGWQLKGPSPAHGQNV